MTMNHAREAACDVEIACARDAPSSPARARLRRHGAYMRTNGAVGARNIAQFMWGHIACRISTLMFAVADHKTPVGTIGGRDASRRTSSRAVVRYGGARPRHRSVGFRRRNLVREAEMPYTVATITPFESKDELDSGDYQVTLDAASPNSAGPRRRDSRANASTAAITASRLLLHRRRRRRAEGKRAAGARIRRHAHGLHGLIGRRAGLGDGLARSPPTPWKCR